MDTGGERFVRHSGHTLAATGGGAKRESPYLRLYPYKNGTQCSLFATEPIPSQVLDVMPFASPKKRSQVTLTLPPTSPKKPYCGSPPLPPWLQEWVETEHLKQFDQEQSLISQTVSVKSMADYAKQRGLSDHRDIQDRCEIVRLVAVWVLFFCGPACDSSTRSAFRKRPRPL